MFHDIISLRPFDFAGNTFKPIYTIASSTLFSRPFFGSGFEKRPGECYIIFHCFESNDAMMMKRLFSFSAAVFTAGAFIYMIGAATRAAVPGMVFDVIRAELGFSASQTAMISSSGVFGCMAFLGISGLLIDRYGWARLILPGVVLQVLGEYILYSGSAPFTLYAGAFLNGGGRTIGYLTLLKFLDSEFDRSRFSMLIGIFYIFSYGGTLLGTAPFEALTKTLPWQDILRVCNALTTACGLCIFLFLHLRKGRNDAPKSAGRENFNWAELVRQLRKPQCLAVIYSTACGIMIYWSILAGAAKKYLSDLCGMPADVLGVMNTIVMLEMIFGGTVSYFCGNRRKVFLAAGSLLLFGACVTLLAGTLLPGYAALCAKAGFLMLGAGYGSTCVAIAAVREFVPPAFAASVIGFVNFCANIMLVALTQAAGLLFDRFPAADPLRVSSAGYAVLFALYSLLAFPAVLCTLFLRDTRGRNISAEL